MSKTPKRKGDTRIFDENTLDNESKRYARQILLEEWDQEKVSNATIFIAGIGALGTISAMNLALMGVKNLILCDYDTVEISNLSRQVLFFDEDIDLFKVDAAKKNLYHWNPDLNIKTFNSRLQDVDKKVFENSDIIIDGLDTFSARRWLNSMAVSLNKPLIHGGLFGWFGNVQIIIPNKTACLECHPLIPQKRLQKPCTPLGKVRSAERKDVEKLEDKKIPSILTVASIIAGIQSQIALKIILNLPLSHENYIFYDGLSNSFTKMHLIKNENCIICSDKFKTKGVELAISEEDTVRSIKDRIIMTWDLNEPFNFMFKGKILDDSTQIKDLHMKNKDTFYIWNKDILQPMKFYAIFSDELKPTKIVYSTKPELHELTLQRGHITKTKQKIIDEASKLNQQVIFYKSKKLSNGKYLIKYKIIEK
ncbi:MAG: ThiF family adenylyltransferase [Candidatus Helarchaeota archaeon]